MHRFRFVGLACLAILAITAIASSTASAALPEFSPAKNKFKEITGGEAKFEQKEGIAAITCKKSTGKGEIETAKSGSFDELYLECTAPLAGKCTGLTDKVAGSILATGSFGLRYITKPTDVAVIFKLSEVHFECEKLITLVTVRGCVVSLVTPLNKKTTTTEVKLKGTKGVQDVTEVLNEANTKNESCKLESEINGGEFKQSSQTQTDKIVAEKEGEIIA